MRIIKFMRKFFRRISAWWRHNTVGYQVIGTNKKTGKREVVYTSFDLDSAVICASLGYRAREEYDDLELR